LLSSFAKLYKSTTCVSQLAVNTLKRLLKFAAGVINLPQLANSITLLSTLMATLATTDTADLPSSFHSTLLLFVLQVKVTAP
jgi:hypothetical protein